MRTPIQLSVVCAFAILSLASTTAHDEAQRSAPIVFEDSGINLSTGGSCFGIALGDVDGDKDLDVFVTQYEKSSRLWLNGGMGHYTMSSQTFGATPAHGAAFGDLDGDGDLDLFLVFNEAQHRVYMNNGSGVFTDSGQRLGAAAGWGDVALGGLDGDGDLDAFVGFGYQITGAPVKLYRNITAVATRPTSWGDMKRRFGG